MFFDRFREAAARLPSGLIRCGPPGGRDAIAAAEATLGKRLPRAFASFLLSFDGADLFHETIVVAGVGGAAVRRLVDLNVDRDEPTLTFAEAGAGDRFAFMTDAGNAAVAGIVGDDRVWLLRAGSDERWLAGADFARWIEAVVAHEQPLYGSDGEFSPDAFEPDGVEVVARVALKQAERALKIDDDAAVWHHERGVALRRLDRGPDARRAFARAAALDATNPWAAFDLGRAALDVGTAGARDALAAFQAAAQAEPGPAGARFLVWAARAAAAAALPDAIAACRREARARNPEIGDDLGRAVAATAAGDDPDAAAEARALLAALEDPIATARARLPVVRENAPHAHAHDGSAPQAARNDRAGRAKRAGHDHKARGARPKRARK